MERADAPTSEVCTRKYKQGHLLGIKGCISATDNIDHTHSYVTGNRNVDNTEIFTQQQDCPLPSERPGKLNQG